jgi:hypothetical protein
MIRILLVILSVLVLSMSLIARAGKEDQGGGLVWRVKDANNYYKDSSFPGPGKIGLWTKADAQCHFDDLKLMEK